MIEIKMDPLFKSPKICINYNTYYIIKGKIYEMNKNSSSRLTDYVLIEINAFWKLLEVQGATEEEMLKIQQALFENT